MTKEKNIKKHIGKLNIKEMLLCPYLEVHPYKTKSKIVLTGVIGVNELDEENILIKCHGLKIRIEGLKLLLNVLEHNTLEIVGKVERINIINA